MSWARNFAPRWVRKSVLHATCNAFTGGVVERTFGDRIPYHGQQIITANPKILRAMKAQILFGYYEASEAYLVKTYLRRDLDLVELGGSVGAVSALCLSRLNADRKVVIVEAHPDLTPVLTRNVAQAENGANATIVNAAIAYHTNHEGVVRFATTKESLSGHIADGDEPDIITVPAVTLSELIKTYGLRDYALVTDIEGAEADIVLHDSAALVSCQQIIIEADDHSVDGVRIPFSNTLDGLRDLGFDVTHARRQVLCLERKRPAPSLV